MVLHVHLTAFGRFAGVPNNPSNLLLEHLLIFIKQQAGTLPSNLLLEDFCVIQVSGVDAVGALQLSHSQLQQNPDNKDQWKEKKNTNLESKQQESAEDHSHLWLHLGVDCSASGMKIENCAVNGPISCF